MTVITLPLQFQNSFWSQDYRKGLEVLFGKLEQGIAENEEIVAFIRRRAAAEAAMAATLTTKGPATVFDTEEAASLHIAFRGVVEESIAQGEVHESIAADLQAKIADPFDTWATDYKERLLSSRATLVDGYLQAYEMAKEDVTKLKGQYLAKARRADEAEDDARFAPIQQTDKLVASPSLGPTTGPAERRTPERQQTMSERITQRFKEFRLVAAPPADLHDAKPAEVTFDAGSDEQTTPKMDKGKGRAVDPPSPTVMASPPPLSPPLPPARLDTTNLPPVGPPIILADASFAHTEISTFLAKAKSELNLRAIRFPLLGEYQDAFTGEEFVTWLKEHVPQFEGNLDRAEQAAKHLTEKMGLLRRLGEFGNEFVDADDSYYQFRTKAFNLEAPKTKQEDISPLRKNLTPLADDVAKRTTTFANLVSKALASSGEPVHVRARREADTADQEYRTAIRQLDRQRLGLEERIEDMLKTLQKWELDRLRAVKTVMLQYQGCIDNFTKAAASSFDRTSNMIASYQPESDLRALIEQYRTGPFRPEAQVYESIAHDESDVVFGVDLRKWAALEASPTSPEKRDALPRVLSTLLSALKDAYPNIPNDDERRKTWIYDVPLTAVHHLRETLNAVPPEQAIPDDALSKYDPPVLAGGIKLWLLELDPPLCLYEGWDELRKLYPSVGTVKDGLQPSDSQRLQELQLTLQKLPMVHLVVLDNIIQHLKTLIESTSNKAESNEVYITKLALSIGRAILRPKTETKFSIQDRHPTLLFIDLLEKYSEILPPTIAKKKRESDRKVPVRRRTRPTDMRMSRSRISAGMDLKELHIQQLAQRMGNKPRSTPSGPPTITLTEEPDGLSEAPSSPEEIVPKGSAPTGPAVPPPPPVQAVVAPPPPPPTFANIPPPPPITPQERAKPPADAPPAFKEPPPEDDDDYPPRPTSFREPSVDEFPPRPEFKDSSPEEDDEELPMPSFQSIPPASPPLPMPKFADPPAEPPTPPPGRFSSVSPPPRGTTSTFARPTSPKAPSRQGSISNRSTSPNKAEAQARAGAGTGPGNGTRAPVRLSGPRGPGGGNVGSMIKNLNRNSIGSSPPGPGIQRAVSPASNTASAANRNHAKRSSAGRSSTFERRTMASDAEDEIVQ